jgi:hypothetical protein
LQRVLQQFASTQFEFGQAKQQLLVAEGDRKLLQARISEMEAAHQNIFLTQMQLQQMNAGLQAKLTLSVDQKQFNDMQLLV